MTDVFLAFAAADADRVAPIARALQSRGFNVFQSPGDGDATARAQLAAAKAVIIFWSKTSTLADWPAVAADSGKDREILVPVFLDDVSPRIGYGQFQGENLAAYPAAPADAAFERLAQRLEALRNGKPATTAPKHVAPVGLIGATGPQSGLRKFILPLGVALIAIAGATQYMQQTKEPTPAPIEQTQTGGGDLGAGERYGLSPADLAALEPQALIEKALTQSTIEAIEASASEDALSGALLCLAQHYGAGAPQDAALARQSCTKSSKAGSALATYVASLGARSASETESADALLQQAADAGDSRAQRDLALARRANNPVGARTLVTQCAAQGNTACQFLLAQMQVTGEGGVKDLEKARRTLEQLDAAFYAPAIVELGKLHRDGVGVPKPDLEEASVRFQRAAVLGDGEANYLLGQMSESGKGRSKDAAKAAEYYAAATAAGYTPAR